MKTLFVTIAALILAVGCSNDTSTARGAGDAFVDAHYVRIDLEASKQLCTGVALDKVLREVELTANVAIADDTQRPRINFGLKEERAAGDAIQLVYELTIRVSGLDPFEKISVVTVRPIDGRWSVTNYVEMDPR